MFDIVSKNKKLSFIISFIKDNISHTSHNDHTCTALLGIQSGSKYIQSKIAILQKTHKPSCFKPITKSSQEISYKNKNTRQHTRQHTPSRPISTYSKPPIQSQHSTSSTNSHQSDQTHQSVQFNPSKPSFYTLRDHDIVLHHDYSPDYMIIGFLLCIDSNFIQTAYHLQLEYIKTLKYKMALELDTHDLYKRFLYNKVRALKKTILQTSLFNDKDILYHNVYRYLGDYFDVNFIMIIDSIFIQYFNEYKDKRITICIQKNNHEYTIDTSHRHDEYIYNLSMDLTEFIKYPGQTFNDFNKLKLADIQRIAKQKEILIMKSIGKKKTKKQLIEDILCI